MVLGNKKRKNDFFVVYVVFFPYLCSVKKNKMKAKVKIVNAHLRSLGTYIVQWQGPNPWKEVGKLCKKLNGYVKSFEII